MSGLTGIPGMPFCQPFSPFCGFQAHLSRVRTPLMEDQTVEVVGQIGKREPSLRSGQADGADKEAITVLLMRKDVLDAGADR